MTGTSLLAHLTTEHLAARLAAGDVVALVPVGSLEPHGPHLPLDTDTTIAVATATRAAALLAERGVDTLVAPAVAYGVTDFAAGFAGAASVPAGALTTTLAHVARSLLDSRFRHVCFVNNHLEPAHDAAVRAALRDLPLGGASVASPLTRRWARTLSDEFKSGACHAGEYETSLMLAIAPELVDVEAARALPDLALSLSEAIAAGRSSFAAIGMARAYTGAPRRASAEHGREMLARLSTMVATEVLEALGAMPRRPPRPRATDA